MFIGIGAIATCGKDTLFNILSYLLKDKVNCERFGLADELKIQVDSFCREKYGISAFTKNPEEKSLIRDLFVVHGKIMRRKTNGRYWVSLLQPKIEQSIQEGNLPICTDIRYAEYNYDEINWLKDNGGVYVHINRFLKNGKKLEAVNEEEKRNELVLEKMADYRLNWQTSDDFNYLTDVAKIQLGGLLDLIRKNHETNKQIQ